MKNISFESGKSRRRALKALGAFGAAATLGIGRSALAEDKVVRIILPNATGSGVDAITRGAQNALSKALGATVIVDNQPGAGGIVGLSALARSAPDGSAISVVSNNVVIFPSVYKSLPFAMPGDFTPIAVCGYTPMILVVNPKVAATSSKELIALLKAKPGELNFASGGNGTILHLATELYLDQAGAKASHIPYKGVGPMLTDLIGGQVQFATAALPSVQGHLKSGALRAIGTTTAQRVAAAPDIPTLAEQGLPQVVIDAWFGVLGPKGMAPAQVARIHEAFVSAFASAEVKEMMAKQGNVIAVESVDEAQAFFRSELVKYAALVKKAGIELQ